MAGCAESHRLNLLAFDTSTEVFSVAVQRAAGGAHESLEHSAAGGAQASAALIPAIQDLLARAGLKLADLDAIVIGRGPGSFTGLRTACSVAQGLAFGAGVPVLPVDTLLAVAEDAHWRAGVTQVVAVLDARMDEVYWAALRAPGGALGRGRATSRWAGRKRSWCPTGWALAGNAFGAYRRTLGRRACASKRCPPPPRCCAWRPRCWPPARPGRPAPHCPCTFAIKWPKRPRSARLCVRAAAARP